MRDEHKYIFNKKFYNKLIQLLSDHKQKTKKVENIIKIYNNLSIKNKMKFKPQKVEVSDIHLKKLEHEFRNYVRSKYKKELKKKITRIEDFREQEDTFKDV